jgi:hypothetical protein
MVRSGFTDGDEASLNPGVTHLAKFANAPPGLHQIVRSNKSHF